MNISDAVDIIVLNCNNNGDIQNCINSIKECTSGCYNLIIVDQDSQDGSKEWLIENNVASHLIQNKRNVGCAEGRNQGVRAGRYPWIAIIDSDIVVKDKQWLDKMWNYTIDRRVGHIQGRVKIHDWETGKWKFAGMAFCLIRRQCFYEVGFFDKRFTIGENDEWLSRLQWSWWKSAFCSDTDILHLVGKTIVDGCLKTKYNSMYIEAKELLVQKYSTNFLEKTLTAYNFRVQQAEHDLLRGK